jgi:hypothetical protein
MSQKKPKVVKQTKVRQEPPLKSASGAGFTFEDKVAALLFCEMLAGKLSLGTGLGLIERIERQAGDWEPFGDILITVKNLEGKTAKCGCSVKSNRPIATNGCSTELRQNLWSVIAKPVFALNVDRLGLFCADLPNSVNQPLNQLCAQAREEDNPRRLDEKITDKKHRKIYDSFASPTLSSDGGFPHHILCRLIPREFDFENITSRSEAAAIVHCREILQSSEATELKANELWGVLLLIAQELRVSGGSTSRERLTARLRNRFVLRGDPGDEAAWSKIRAFSSEWLDQIETTLLGGLNLPRADELNALQDRLSQKHACHVVGDSGSGKSALVKALVQGNRLGDTEVVWIKAELFGQFCSAVPNFIEIASRVRSPSALVVFDGVESSYDPENLKSIAQAIAALTEADETPWRVILTCQTPEWSRVSFSMLKVLAGRPVLTEEFECGLLSGADFDLVRGSYPSVLQLSKQSHLQRLLKSPKILDILLRGQFAEGRSLACEADLVDWWWEQQVKQSKPIAAEENVARQLAARMADELCTELAPDTVIGAEAAAVSLVRNRVLRTTRDGRLRFDHDLLADWSRVMHLRALGDKALDFMRTHAENPPWLRAIRLLSQHHLERIADFETWRAVVASCSTRSNEDNEPTAGNLSVLDSWLEGIAYCTDVKQILDRLTADLFGNDGWLFRRFISRLLHVGTVPDPVIQENFRQMDPSLVEAAGTLCRLPQPRLWTPVINFLIEHKTEVTDHLPIELAEIASMWSRLEQYLNTPWLGLADIVLLSGEKEFRQEVAGKYRFDRGPVRLGGGHESRVKIYAAALRTASQFPDRVAKLLLKASGRAPWEVGDLSPTAEESWRGEWHERSHLGRWSVYIKEPPESWPDGPRRRTSDDFFHAWFELGVAQILYKKLPHSACEATLAFLVSWPKSELIKLKEGYRHSGYEVDRRGFTSNAAHMYPPFWTKGSFLVFLRENWRPALEAIIRLVNFATDLHQDWWQHSEVSISTPAGKVKWKGHPHVYAWHHFNMNSADVVTCALMALEKWLDEQIEAKKPITDAVKLLYEKSNSFASAGLLISLGKRHPHLFISDLKPLLFVRDFYICDIHSTLNYFGAGSGQGDGKIVNQLRQQWSRLTGRKTQLKDLCLEWLLTKPEFAPVFSEVVTAWRNEANKFPDGSEEQIVLLRWASDFDRSTWKPTIFPDGQKGWTCERPATLQNDEEAQRILRIQKLITLPQQCSTWLDQNQQFTDEQLESIWQQLQNWTPFEQLGAMEGEQEEAITIRDHRHARAGLVAVLLCAGDSWLNKYSVRREWLEKEVLKIIAHPPKVFCFSPEEIHDDYESLLARAIVKCWSRSPRDANWRGYVASFVTAHRYHTVGRLFQEAFKVRSALGNAYRELEAFALAFAAERKRATQFQFFRTRSKINATDLDKWGNKWLRKFAAGNGPNWNSDWSQIEATEPFRNDSPSHQKSSRREELYRRDYGFDMGVILAAFGHFPALVESQNDQECAHWFAVCKEMVAAFCRTLPNADATVSADAEWHYDHWSPDEKIFGIAARRLFECKPAEQKEIWGPIVSLPVAAHHHICSFLDQLLIESLSVEPYRIAELIPIWRGIAEQVFSLTEGPKRGWSDYIDIQKHVLLYDSIPSAREEFWGPLVEDLRPRYKQHLGQIAHDAHDQSSFAAFLITKAGERLLIDVLVCLQPAWDLASDYFWETVVERNHFANLLEYAWHNYYPIIRTNQAALKAFKTLTLKLAIHHVPIALEVQRQI